jgi:hypothetical protein
MVRRNEIINEIITRAWAVQARSHYGLVNEIVNEIITRAWAVQARSHYGLVNEIVT